MIRSHGSSSAEGLHYEDPAEHHDRMRQQWRVAGMSEAEARIVFDGITTGALDAVDLMWIAQDYQCWIACSVKQSAERIRQHRYQQEQVERYSQGN